MRVRSSALALSSVGLGFALYALLPSDSVRAAFLTRPFELASPRALAALALVPLAHLFATRSLAHLSLARRRLASGLRAIVLSALAVALARPATFDALRRSSTVFVVDVSDSIGDTALERARAYVSKARKAASREQHIEVVTFAREPVRLASSGAPIARASDGSATDIARALAFALGLHEAEATPQIALFSDARETEGAGEQALARIAQRGVALFYEPARDRERAEVAIVDLALPREVRAGESFELRAHLFASQKSRVSVRLTRDDAPNTPESERDLELTSGENHVRFQSVALHPGPLHYELSLTPRGPDTFPENNRFARSTLVRGAPRVLYVERGRAESEAFARLLRSAAFEVDVRLPSTAPKSSDELAQYAFYVLSDVSAAALGPAALRAIRAYVEGGGGFLMAGGEQSFGSGGYQGSELEPILPVALGGALEREEPTVALMLAIDKSGSMAGEKLERAKEATLATAALLGSENYLGVIGFDAEAVRVVRLAVASQTSAIARSVSTLAAGGGTALFPALDAAYRDLVGVRARIKHVVVLTDGQSQEEALDDLVASMRLDGVTVSMVGLGDDVNRGLLERLAKAGGGRAYFTRDPARVPRLFTEEAQVVARSPLRERALRAELVRPAAFARTVDVALAPPLRGVVATRARAAPAELLLRTDTGEPLLARMRVGLGWSLAFTSDVKGRWSADWYRWRELPRLFSALLREHMRSEANDARAVAARFEGDLLIASVDVLDEGPRFVNGLTGSLRIASNVAGAGGAREIPLVQTAAGRYEARTPLAALGSYTLEARLEGGSSPVLARGEISRPFPSEYAWETEGEPPLHKALISRAKPLPAPSELLAASSRDGRRERWPALVWLALVAFLLDLSARRLPPWSDRERPST